MNQKNVPAALARYLSSVPRAALAFSGGVDSSYLLYAAQSCGIDTHAYFVHSQFQPRFELDDARRLAGELGIGITVIPLDILQSPVVSENPPDRCYHCKRLIFEAILHRAALDGCTLLLDGSNASDDAGDRPGMRALAELRVVSPLRAAGLTKAQVRENARRAGLFIWEKPAYACLATRVPAGTPITEELLFRIEQAEKTLAQLGFSDFRARVMGAAVRLQLPAGQLPLAAARHAELTEALAPWFEDVLLDLKPREST